VLIPGGADGGLCEPELGIDPEESLRLARLADDARRAIARLPENQRLVFLFKVDQELSYEEIAAIMKCPVGTVKSRLHHAVRRLRELMRAARDGGEASLRGDRHVL
jgi:RNA polymerase sigma-70 factor (ECF subfamily)